MATKKNVDILEENNKTLSAELLGQMEQEAGSGYEGMSNEDVGIPFLTILQSLSPQVKAKSPKRIEGAEEGDIFNTVNEETRTSIVVIPCAYQKAYVEWIPRDQGGGFVRQHTDPAILDTAVPDGEGSSHLMLSNGNSIVPTAYHYVLVVSENGALSPAIMAMSSTGLKKSRLWNGKMREFRVRGSKGFFNPPMYAQQYMVTTEQESNAMGEWYNWRIGRAELVADMDWFRQAKEFHELIIKGKVQMGAPPSENNVGKGFETPEKEIPF